MHGRFVVGWGPVFLAMLLVMSSVSRAAEAGSSVTVGWFLSWEPNISGYQVHYGTESRDYDTTVDAGN